MMYASTRLYADIAAMERLVLARRFAYDSRPITLKIYEDRVSWRVLSVRDYPRVMNELLANHPRRITVLFGSIEITVYEALR